MSFEPARSDAADAHAAFFAAAVAVSLAVHAAFGWAAGDAHVPLFSAVSPAGATAEQLRRLRHDSAVRARLVPPEPAVPGAAEDRPARDAAAAPDPGERLFPLVADAPVGLFEPPPPAPERDATVGGLAPPPPDLAAAESQPEPWAPREKIVEIASRFANEDLLAVPPRPVAEVERTVAASDVLPPARLVAAPEAAGGRSALPAWAAPAPAREDLRVPAALLAAPAPAAPAAPAIDRKATAASAAAYLAEVPEEVSPDRPIESVLDAAIAVHRPRTDDGFVYFRVDVTRRGADVLPPVPRNILFAQDASRSIAPERLHQCREAFKKVIAGGLLPTDRFNVLAFNTANTYAFPDGWRVPSAENAAAAAAFLDAVRSEGNTDIYNAMKGVLDLPREPGRSTIVFLLTDGVATAGDVRRDSGIIGEFSARNAGGVSVFDVGVSKKSDEYLLSMLSFCNRGGPAVVAADRFAIPKTVAAAVSAVGSPVLTDIRFLFDSTSGAVVTPRMTENLYLDRPLRLYGRAPAGTDEVTFQARGTNGGKKYDMVFTLRLGAPKPGEGDSSIATDWARTRIYDLVAAYAREQDPATVAEMARIGREHGVPIPFGGRFPR